MKIAMNKRKKQKPLRPFLLKVDRETRMLNRSLFSSNKQDWTTPNHLYNELNSEFAFDFDPCPIEHTFDGLIIEWGKSNFVNPPYNEIKKWIKKGYGEFLKGKT